MQTITQSYDFRKTWYRNFYNNRLEGMVKGSGFGRFARSVHRSLAPEDTFWGGSVWNGNEWIPTTGSFYGGTADYTGGVDIVQAFDIYKYLKEGSALADMVPILESAITWMIGKDMDNANPFDLCVYRPGSLANLTPEAISSYPKDFWNDINNITEVFYKIDFFKMTERQTDTRMLSHVYNSPEPTVPLYNVNGQVIQPAYSPDGKCIFYPDTNIEVPMENISFDPNDWDLTGETLIIGRQYSGKYTCDILDTINDNNIANDKYTIPMRYSMDPDYTTVIPDPNAILKDAPDEVRKALSIVMFYDRPDILQSAVFFGMIPPVFSGLYVTPLFMLYQKIVKLRNNSIDLGQ